MRETTGKCGKIQEIFLSCPIGSERLATALGLTAYGAAITQSHKVKKKCYVDFQIKFKSEQQHMIENVYRFQVREFCYNLFHLGKTTSELKVKLT